MKFVIGSTKGVSIICLVNSSKTSLDSCREGFLEILKSAARTLDADAPSLSHNVTDFFIHDDKTLHFFEHDWPQIARVVDVILNNGQFQRKNNLNKVYVYAIYLKNN